MKKYQIILFVCLIFTAKLTAEEEVSVEKSIFCIQTGVMGLWAINEVRLANTIALRSEAGFAVTNWAIGRSFYDNEAFIPLTLSVEPRYYFDIKKRYSKGLRIDNNSATFFSVKINYHAGWLMLSGKQPSNIQIMPTYAARKNTGKHFNFEIGGGMGYQHTFTSIKEEKNIWAFNIVLRIGYTF